MGPIHLIKGRVLSTCSCVHDQDAGKSNGSSRICQERKCYDRVFGRRRSNLINCHVVGPGAGSVGWTRSLPGRKGLFDVACRSGIQDDSRAYGLNIAPKLSVLVADIGGTNCRFQLWELDKYLRPTMMAKEQIYPTKDYEHFDDALKEFLLLEEVASNPPKAAAFACAGPVKNNRCTFTNLKWVVDKKEVEKEFGIVCRVLNDFEAIGYGVTTLGSHEILTLHDVPGEKQGPIAVLGPGTGMGQAQLFWDDSTGNYKVHPSEGSHSTFAPRGYKQRALQARVEAERGHCSVERVGCGSGLVRIYDFLHSDECSNRPNVKPMEDATPASISIAALDGSDAVASEALDMFLSIIGAEASHMALRGLTTGGVYIAGGILPKVIDRVTSGGLLEAFLWKASRFHEKVLKYIPLHVVLEERVGLMGTREIAIQLVQQHQTIEESN